MTTTNNQVAAAGAAGAGGGPSNRTPAISVGHYDIARYVVDKIAKVVPTYAITIKARQEVKIEIRGDVAEIGCNGITLRSGDWSVDMDPRYNSAVERRIEGYRERVTVSDKVEYRGVVYEVKDFVELFKRRVKELIEETAATVGL
ncbi:MAG: hypothetical protein ACO2PN_27770 [Pyrobaculum sp.]|jgi:hypothetical protein